MKHFILNQHFKLCWLCPCNTGTLHRIKKTQYPMSLGSYTSYIDHKKLLVVEILCPCWVFPQCTQLQLSCFYTHYPLISKCILTACLWSSIQFPTFSLHWSLPMLCPSQCIPFFYWWTLRRIERWDEFNTHLFPHPTCKRCSWCWTTLCPPFDPLLSEAQGADLPHVACQGGSLPGIISPLPEAHLHFKDSGHQVLIAFELLPLSPFLLFLTIGLHITSHDLATAFWSKSRDVPENWWGFWVMWLSPKKNLHHPFPIEFSAHTDHLVPIRDWAINTSGWVPGLWGLLCSWFSLIYRTVF